MLKWIYKDKNSTYLVWVYRFEKKIIERAPFKANRRLILVRDQQNLLRQSHIDNEAGPNWNTEKRLFLHFGQKQAEN